MRTFFKNNIVIKGTYEARYLLLFVLGVCFLWSYFNRFGLFQTWSTISGYINLYINILVVSLWIDVFNASKFRDVTIFKYSSAILLFVVTGYLLIKGNYLIAKSVDLPEYLKFPCSIDETISQENIIETLQFWNKISVAEKNRLLNHLKEKGKSYRDISDIRREFNCDGYEDGSYECERDPLFGGCLY